MGWFKNWTDSVKRSLEAGREKREKEKELINQARLEADIAARQAFVEDFKKHTKEVAISQAKKDAAKLSGIQKLRAQNRLRNLQKNQDPGGFFSKIRDHCSRNRALREENLERTKELRGMAKDMKHKPRNDTKGRKPFQPTRLGGRSYHG